MYGIYGIDDLKSEAARKMIDLSNRINDEYEKPDMDKNKIFDLMYQQFIQGLKLNTGIKYY